MVRRQITDETFEGTGVWVPKDVVANLRWRAGIWEWGARGQEEAEALKAMCRADASFFFNAFLWVFEPRRVEVELLGKWRRIGPLWFPFVLREYQERMLGEYVSSVDEGRDLAVPKCRTVGATVLAVGEMLRRFVLYPMSVMGMMSRVATKVDKRGDPDTLFYKFDEMLRRLPDWMRPRTYRSAMHVENLDNGSVLDGETTTGEAFVSGRKLLILMDELAKFGLREGREAVVGTQEVSPTRWFVSTPKGNTGAFAEMCRKPKLRRCIIQWHENPSYARGLYRASERNVELLDDQDVYDKDYEFVRDGMLRSRWLDEQWHRRESDAAFRQEYLIDFGASSAPFYPPDLLAKHKARYCCEPVFRGSVDKGPRDEPVWTAYGGGPVLLWCSVGADGLPPSGRYVMGVDVSAGSERTNSTFVVWDMKTGETVARGCRSNRMPHEWAQECALVARWFGGIKIIWEGIGPGISFGETLWQIGYRNVHWRTSEAEVRGGATRRQRRELGLYPSSNVKIELHERWKTALAEELSICRDEQALAEAAEFSFITPKRIAHTGSVLMGEYSTAESNHGDIATAAALGWHLARHEVSARARTQDRGKKTFPPTSHGAMMREMASEPKQSFRIFQKTAPHG